ncbi:hypothetical protein ISCGN_019629 [Ixodes scapularis]
MTAQRQQASRARDHYEQSRDWNCGNGERPPRASLKVEWWSKPREEGWKGGKRGNRGHKRARRISLYPTDVPRWDCLLRFKSNNRQELVRRRWFVGDCRGCWPLQWDSIGDTELCGVVGQKSVFVTLVGRGF